MRESRSSSSDGQAELDQTSSRNRLKCDIQQLGDQQFQGAQRDGAVIQCAIHGDGQEHSNTDQKEISSPIHQQKTQAFQNITTQSASTGDQVREVLPICHLHQVHDEDDDDSTSTRVAAHLRHEDVSNVSSNPSVSTAHCAVRHVATQMSCKVRGLGSQAWRRFRENVTDVQEEEEEAGATSTNSSQSASSVSLNLITAANSSQSTSASSAKITAANSSQSGSGGTISAKSTYDRELVHDEVGPEFDEFHEPGCAMPYSEVVNRVADECHLHRDVEEHTSPRSSNSRDSRKVQRRCNGARVHHPERGVQTHPTFTCHQRVTHQSLFHHQDLNVCHLHRDDDDNDDDHAFLTTAAPSQSTLMSRASTTSSGLPEPGTKKEFIPPESAHHHSPKADDYAKMERICVQMISPPNSVRGGGGGRFWPEKSDICGKCGHFHKDHHVGKFHHGCDVHRDSWPPNPNCQEPRHHEHCVRMKRRPSTTSMKWLNKAIAAENIPPHIVRQFLKGRRKWTPEAVKQSCPGCVKKGQEHHRHYHHLCPRPLIFTPWNLAAAASSSNATAKKNHHHHDENLTRRLTARTQIIKPIVKLSTSKEVWRSRKEHQFCSECWNPRKFGRWASILDVMSKDESGEDFMPKCFTKLCSQTAHGNPIPCDTGGVNLQQPKLFSASYLRLRSQKLQSQIFDRPTALQVAQMKCIKLDKEVLIHVPAKVSPPKVDRSKQPSPSPQRCHEAIAKKTHEPYAGLTTVAQYPNPICRGAAKEVAVQTNRGPKLMPRPFDWDPGSWMSLNSQIQSPKHWSTQQTQSSLRGTTCPSSPIYTCS